MKSLNKVLKSKALIALLGSMLVAVSAQAAEKIVLKGSDTLGAKWVPQLAEEFKGVMKAKGVDVTFEIAAEGSSTGVAAVIDGTSDIGMSSRDVKDKEYAKAESMGVKIAKITGARDGIAIIVNEKNPLTEITLQQVEQIFTGDVSDWSAVGGRRGNISAYTRNTSSGTYKVFQELGMNKRDYGADSQKMAGNEQIATEVAKNPNGIGYVGLAYINTPGVKVLPVDGVQPAANGYPIARDLYFLIDKNKPMSEISNLFLGFCMSPKAQEITDQVHFLPLY
jgi:phosphate transport system substrate-binding protein